MTPRIKICGVTRPDDARVAIDEGADLIGVNFYNRSPRYVSIYTANEIRRAIGGAASMVGVFVNAEREFISDAIGELGLDMIQFHGDETFAQLVGWRVPTIRAYRLKDGEPFDPSQMGAGYALLDTLHPTLYGGSGVSRSLESLRNADLSRVFISGGLDAETVAAACALSPYGVDVASGVESAPGIKDHDKLRRFIRNARSSR
jgi:phosphoribosylanthranilate isomerase